MREEVGAFLRFLRAAFCSAARAASAFSFALRDLECRRSKIEAAPGVVPGTAAMPVEGPAPAPSTELEMRFLKRDSSTSWSS